MKRLLYRPNETAAILPLLLSNVMQKEMEAGGARI